MDEYFDACPFGKFGDPAIRANDEGVALLMHLVGQRQIIGSDPRDGSGVTLAQFNYFTFAGGDEQVWSASLYARLAYEGFFTITQQGGSKPLPELQPFYSVVDWHNFARSRHVRRALQRMRRKMAPPTCGLRVPDEGGGEGLGGDGSGGGESGREIVSEHADGDACFELVCARGAHDVWRAIDDYHTRTQGSNWLTRKYLGVMQRASEDPGINFTLHAIELHRCEPSARGNTGPSTVIAGELGYSIGRIYTSLSGFSTNTGSAQSLSASMPGVGTGTMQLVLLGQWLQRRGYAFWSLGHCYSPAMDYKRQLGHRVWPREAFLEKLRVHRGTFRAPAAPCTESGPPLRPGDRCDCASLLAPADGLGGSMGHAVEAAAEEQERREPAKQAAMDSWDDDLVTAATKKPKPKPKQTGGKKKKGKKGKKK